MDLKKQYTKSEIREFTCFIIFIVLSIISKVAKCFIDSNTSGIAMTLDVLSIIFSAISIIFFVRYIWKRK